MWSICLPFLAKPRFLSKQTCTLSVPATSLSARLSSISRYLHTSLHRTHFRLSLLTSHECDCLFSIGLFVAQLYCGFPKSMTKGSFFFSSFLVVFLVGRSASDLVFLPPNKLIDVLESTKLDCFKTLDGGEKASELTARSATTRKRNWNSIAMVNDGRPHAKE